VLLTDINRIGPITAKPERSAPLAARLWAEIKFEYQVRRVRKHLTRELSTLPDRLLEDIGTYRGDLHRYADRAARQWIAYQLQEK